MYQYQSVGCEDCEECQRERLALEQNSKSCKSCKKKVCECESDSEEELDSEISNLTAITEPQRKTYIITKGKKKGHPWSSYNRGLNSIYVNGINGPTLHLHYGVRYCFRFDQPGFILTTSPMGGVNAKIVKGEFEIISKNSFEFEATDDTPRYFFYQDDENNFEGGIIHVE